MLEPIVFVLNAELINCIFYELWFFSDFNVNKKNEFCQETFPYLGHKRWSLIKAKNEEDSQEVLPSNASMRH